MMPSVSSKQHNLMAAVANNPAFAKKTGIPQSVGQEFMSADKGKKFGSGGEKTRADSQGVNKPKTNHGDMALFKKGGDMKESKAMVKKEVSFMKAKGAPKSMIKHEAAEMGAMKKGGAVKKMNSGGSPVPVQQLPYMGPKKESPPKPIHPAGLGRGTSTTPKAPSMDEYKRGGGVKKMAAGGFTRAADGIAKQGKTKAKQISMAGNKGMKSGGMAKKYC